MYSKKTLKEALMQEPPAKAKWALFPLTLNKEESLAVWIVPQKMRLLRLLGMEYEVRRKKGAPLLMRAQMKGLVVERVSTVWVSQFYYDEGIYDKPVIFNKPAPNPYAMVGLRDCRICISQDIGVWIGLQHFIEEVSRTACPSILGWQSDPVFKELCSMYCHTDDLLAEYITTTEATEFYMKYHIVIPPDMGLLDWVKERGGCKELEDFAQKRVTVLPSPADQDQYEFRLSVNFGQVEKEYALAFIQTEVWGNGGHIILGRNLDEFNSQEAFLGLVENSLRKALPYKMEERFTNYPNSCQSQVEEYFENLDEEEIVALETPEPVAIIAAFRDAERDRIRNEERWRNIMGA